MRASFHLVRLGFLLALAAAALSAPSLARADDAPLAASDRAAIRKVIEDQIAAFRRDDGETAFGFASPGIRDQFGSADNFMDMVKSGYAPVYRPKKVDFGALEVDSGTILQHVFLVGPDGQLVEAIYFMEREADGSWRISGCVLTQSDQTTS